eukprot:3558894-Rhodomonas_salina.2
MGGKQRCRARTPWRRETGAPTSPRSGHVGSWESRGVQGHVGSRVTWGPDTWGPESRGGSRGSHVARG